MIRKLLPSFARKPWFNLKGQEDRSARKLSLQRKGTIEALESRIAPATVTNFPVASSISAFGETNTAYYAQSFVAADSVLNQVQFVVNGSGGPDANEFHALIVSTMGGTELSNPTGIQPNAVLFESSTLVAPVGAGATTFTVNTGSLALTPGATYALVLDAYVTFDGSAGVSSVASGAAYSGGHFFYYNVGGGTRTSHFNQNWTDDTGSDLAFSLEFSNPTAQTSVTLSSGALTVSDVNGGTSNDNLAVSLVSGNIRITDAGNTLTGGPGTTQVNANTVDIPLGSVTSLLFDTLGGDDTVTLNLGTGDFIPNGGLSFAGGAGGNDSLVISGGTQGTVTYNHTNSTDGNIVMSNFGTVTYTGLDPITNTGTATDVTFNLPTALGTNTVTLGDDGTGGNGLSRLSGANFELTNFANPTGTLTINRGTASDTIALTALPDFTASLAIGTSANPFAGVNISGSHTLAATKTLSVFSSGTVGTSAAITAPGGMSFVAGDINLGGTLSGSGPLTLTSAGNTIGVGSGAGAFSLGASDLANILPGFSSVSIGGTAVTTISEDFAGNTLPAGFEVDGPSISFSGGQVIFNGGGDAQRTNLRTIADDYFGKSFTAEVTVTVNASNWISFFGMGTGVPNSEPQSPSIHTRMHPLNGGASGQFDINDNGTNFGAALGNPGNGTHRVRLSWNATTQQATYQIDVGYAGGAFTADATAGPYNGGDNGFTDLATRIFFGGSQGVIFDDFLLTSTGRSDININTATVSRPTNFVGNNISLASLTATSQPVSFDGKVTPSGNGVDVSASGVSFVSGSDLRLAIGGTAVDTGYQQLNVAGTVNLTGVNLVLSGAYVPATSDSFILVNNDGADAVVGAFNGLPEGTMVNVNGVQKRLTYTGGDGNDVALVPPTTTDIVVSGGNLTITDTNGGNTNDTLTLVRNGTNIRISDSSNPILAGSGATQINLNTVEVPFASISGGLITFNTLGGDDVLTLDFSGGNILTNGGISYAGGTQGGVGDRLVVTGGSTTTVTHIFTNANDGAIVLVGTLAGTISYTGLEPITDNLSATDRVFTFDGGTETIVVADAAGANISIDSTAGEIVTFANPTGSITINGGNGDDTISVNSLDAAYAGSLTISGDANNDNVTLSAGLPALSGLTIDADTIAALPALTIGAGGLTLTASNGTITTSGAISSVGAMSFTANDLAFNGGANSLTSASSILLRPNADASTIGIGAGAAGTFNLNATDLAALTDGFSSIAIGRAGTGTGAVSITSSIFKDNVSIHGGSTSVTGLNAGTNDVSITARSGPIYNGGDALTDIIANNLVLTKIGGGITSDAYGIGGNNGGGGNARVTIDATTLTATSDAGTIAVITVGTGGVAMSLNTTGAVSPGNLFVTTATEDVVITNATSGSGGFFQADVTGFNLSVTSLSGPIGGNFNTIGSGNVTLNSVITGGAGNAVNVNSAGTLVVNSSISASGNVSFITAGSITGAGAVTSNSALGLTSTAGGVNLTGVITAPGVTTIAAGAANNVTLANANNNFGSVGVTSGNNISLVDINAITLNASTISGTLGVAGVGITVGGTLGIGNDATLTSTGGVTFNAGVAMAANRSLTATSTSTTVGISLANANADLTTSGTGNISLTTSRDLSLAGGSSTIVTDGTVTLSANAAGTTAGTFEGIVVNGATVQATGTGVVSITGVGGTIGGSQHGVDLIGNALVSGGSGLGNKTLITGTGGNLVGGNGSIGVVMGAATVTSAGGDVMVTGTGGNGGTSGEATGVYMNAANALITSGGTGSVSVTGSGGNGPGETNTGIDVRSGSQITSSGGNVTVIGTGGSNANSNNIGVRSLSGSLIGAGGTGTLTVIGTGGAAAGFVSDGVRAEGANARIGAANGLTTITGSASNGNSFGLAIVNGGIVGTGGTNPLIINSDSVDVAANGVINSGTAQTTIQPRTAGTQINLGGADVLTGSPLTLGLTDAELGRITAGSLNIGNAATGTITSSASVVLNDGPVIPILTVTTGSAIVDGNGATNNFTVSQLVLNAPTGVGSVADAIETAVTSLDVNNATSGGVYIANSGALTITDLNATPATIAGGAISASSPLTISASQTITAATSFTAGNSAANDDDITINGGAVITLSGAGSYAVTFNAGDDINFSTGSITSTGGAKTVNLNADQEGAGGGDTDRGSVTQTGTTTSVTANVLNIAAQEGIGTAGTPFRFDAVNLSTSSAGLNGNQFLHSIAATNVTSLNAGSGAGTPTSGTINLVNGTFNLVPGDAVADTSAVVVTSPAILNLNSDPETFGSLAGNGTVDLGSTPAGNLDDYAVFSTGTLVVATTGTYTFGLNTDDGARLRIDLNGDSVLNALDDIIVDDVQSAPHDKFGTPVALNAGNYLFEWVYFERGGGDEGELFYAPGSFVSFDPAFRLVGDSSQGISLLGGTLTATTYQQVATNVSNLANADAIRLPANIQGTGAFTTANFLGIGGGGNFGGDNTPPGYGSTGTGTLTVGGNGASTTFSGVIGIGTDTGGLIKTGAGTLTLTGANIYSGGTSVDGGTVTVNGSIANSATTINNTGILSGSGTTGAIIGNSGGTLSPGNGVGILNSANLGLNAGSVFSVTINGSTTPGTDYDRQNVNGSVSLGGSTLSINGTIATNPGQQITLITNDGADAVIGTFNGLAEGALFTINSVYYRISYVGGTGNDVVLSEATESIVALSGGNAIFTDVNGGNSNDNVTVIRNGANVRFTDPVNPILAGAGATQIDAFTVEIPMASITGSIQLNTLAGNDTGTLNFSGGTIFPAGGISYAGGNPTTGPGDQLVITGGTTTTVTHTFTNANDGTVTLAGVLAGTIAYTGLEPITDNLSATNRVFTFNGGSETIAVTDSGGADGNSMIDSTLGESVIFANPTGSLTINAGTGDDTINVTSLDAAFGATVTINGDAANDTINFSAGLPTLLGLTTNSETLGALPTMSIGASGLNLTTTAGGISQIGTLSVTGTTTLSSAGAIALGNANNFVGALSAAATSAGNINILEASGGFTVTSASTTAGSITLVEGETNDGPGFNDDLTITGLVNAVGGSVTLRTGDDLTITAAGQVTAATTVTIAAASLVDLDNHGGVSINGAVSGGGLVSISAFDNVDLGANVTSTAGNATITSTNANITRLAGTVSAADLTLTATIGSIGAVGAAIQTSVNTLTSTSTGNQVITEANGLTGLNLNAGAGDITLTLTAGAITDADGGTDVTATNLVVTAPGGLGTAANPIGTNITSLTTTTNNTDQFFTETNDLNGINLNAGTGSITLVISAGGITDNDGATDVVATNLTITSVNAIGNVANPISTVVDTITATTVNANQAYAESNGLTALNLDAGNAGIDITLAAGAVTDTDGATDITAGSVAITAPAGIGSGANPIGTSVNALTTTTTNTNQFFTEVSGLTALNLNAGTGDITVTVLAGSITDTDAATDIVAGNLTLTTPGVIGTAANPINLAVNTLAATTTNSSQFFTETNSIALNLLSAGTGTVTVDVAAGAITDNNAGAQNVTASGVRLTAATGIGTVADPIETTVTNLEAQTATGGVFINETDGLTIGGVSALNGVSATSGNIVINSGALTISENISTPNNVILTSTGSITEAGGAVQNAALLQTTSVGGQTLNGANTVSSFDAVNTGSGNLSLANTAPNLTIIRISELVGNATVTNVGNVTLGDATNQNINVSGIASITATGGAITDGNAGNNITAVAAILSAGNGVGTVADPIETNIANVEAAGGTGGVFINEANTLTIGGISAVVGVSAGGNIAINSGALTIAENIAGGANVTLNSTGTIVETTGAITTPGTLNATSVGGQDLQNAGNQIGTFVSTNSGANTNVLLENTFNNFTIGNVSNPTGGNVVLDNNLGVNATITGTISSGGALGGDITVLTEGTLTVALGSTVTSAGGTGGTLTISSNVVINGNVIVGFGDVTLQGGAGTLIVNSPLSVSSPLVLQATDDILIFAPVETTSSTSDLTVIADIDGNGIGGVLIDDNATYAGALKSGRNLTVRGSNLTAANDALLSPEVGGVPNAVIITSNGSTARMEAVGNVLIDINGAAPASSAIYLGGLVRSNTSGDVVFDNAVLLVSDDARALTHGVGDVVFLSTVNGGSDLHASTDTGVVLFNGVVGGTTPVGDIVVDKALDVTIAAGLTGSTLTVSDADGTVEIGGPVTVTGTGTSMAIYSNTLLVNGSVNATAGNIFWQIDNLAIANTVGGTGTLTIQPETISRSIGLNGTGDLNLTLAEINFLQDGFTGIQIGRPDGSGAIQTNGVNGALAPAATFKDPISLLSPAAGGLINIDGRLQATGNGAFSLTAPTINLNVASPTATFETVGGAVTLTGNIKLLANTLIDTNSGAVGGNVTFNGAVNGAFSLTVDALDGASGGTVSFGGAPSSPIGGASVGGSAPLTSVLVQAGTINLLPQVITTGNQTYSAQNAINAFAGALRTKTGGAVLIDGPLNLNETLPIITEGTGANVTFTGTVESVVGRDGGLRITAGTVGNVAFQGNVGATNALTGVEVTQAANITAAGTLRAIGAIKLTGTEINFNGGAGSVSGGSIVLQTIDPTQAVYVGGAADSGAGVLDITSADIAALADGFSSITISRVNGNAGLTIAPAGVTFTDPVTFRQATGSGFINVLGDVTGTGNASATFTGSGTNLGADVTTAGGAITFDFANLTTDVVLTSNGGAVTFNDSVYDSGSGQHDLTINAGSGDVTFKRYIGTKATAVLGDVTVNSTGITTITNGLIASTFTTNVGGTTQLRGQVKTSGAGGINIGDDVVLNGSTRLNALGAGPIIIGGDVDSKAGKSYSLSAQSISGNITIAGDVGTNSIVSALKARTTGNVSVTGTVETKSINVRGSTLTIDDVTTSSAQTYRGATLNFTGALSASKLSVTSDGNITNAAPWTITNKAVLKSKTGSINITGAGNAFGSIQLAGLNATVVEDSDLTIVGAKIAGAANFTSTTGDIVQTGSFQANSLTASAADSIKFTGGTQKIAILNTITATSDITILSGGTNLTLQGAISTVNGDVIISSNYRLSNNNIINTFGAGVITISGAGRFLLYSYSPLLTNLGGLAVDFTENGKRYPTPPLGSNTGDGVIYFLS